MATSDAPLNVPNVTLAVARGASSGGGSLSPGQTISLTQGNYGVGPTIVGGSNFEALTEGQDLGGAATDVGYKTQFSKQTTAPVTVDTTKKHSGTKSAKVEWLTNTISAFGWTGMNAGTKHLRISYWRWQNTVYDTGADASTINRKQWYVFGTNAEYPQAMLLVPKSTIGWGIFNNGDTQIVNYNFTSSQSEDRWEHWDIYLYAGSGVATNDSIIEIRRNGLKFVSSDTYNFQEFSWQEGSWDDFRLGHMMQEAIGSQTWYDELLVTSGGPQAIYVTPNPTWDDTLYSAYDGTLEHEMACQTPASWSNAEITFDFNASAIPSATPLYCHVIKADRSVVTHSIGEI